MKSQIRKAHIKGGLMKRSKFITKLAEFKIRLSLGQGWFYELRNAVLISASLKVLFDLSLFLAGGVTLIILMCFYLAGAFDIKFLKLYQRMQELRTSKYNPHLNKIK